MLHRQLSCHLLRFLLGFSSRYGNTGLCLSSDLIKTNLYCDIVSYVSTIFLCLYMRLFTCYKNDRGSSGRNLLHDRFHSILLLVQCRLQVRLQTQDCDSPTYAKEEGLSHPASCRKPRKCGAHRRLWYLLANARGIHVSLDT